MLRTFLLFFLPAYLLPALLPAPASPAAGPATVYIHSRHCQELNYLHIDCFEGCNGAQDMGQPGAGHPLQYA